MTEISLVNILLFLAWSTTGLWLIALLWTLYCFKKQKPLSMIRPAQNKIKPFVSIIVPARNEAHRVLRESIDSMLAQNYENYELIVVNDRSTDHTKEILEKIFQNQSKIPNPKSKIVDGIEPSPDWLGKPHALQQAFKQSTGDWILSTDADIIFAPETLQTVVEYAQNNNFDAVTLIPKQLFGSFWERVFMPVFGWFCLLKMPLHRVNDPRRRESMGVGNFFMFRRVCLEAIGGFECVKAEVAEDLKLGEILKAKGFNLRIDYAPELIETRMYSGFGGIWEGFTKNLFSGMKFSFIKTVCGVFSILLFGVLPVIFAGLALIPGNFELFIPLILIYVLQVSILALANREWQGSVVYSLFAPLGLALFLAILINSTVRVLSGKGVIWKGRAIYERGGVQPPH